MTIHKNIFKQSIKGLYVKNTPPPSINPPQWDSQPNPQFVGGSPSSYEIRPLTSDIEGDALVYSLNTGTQALPSGVTWTTGIKGDGVGYLDGGNIGDFNFGTSSDFTYEFRVINPGNSTSQSLLLGKQTSGGLGWGCYLLPSSNRLLFSLNDGSHSSNPTLTNAVLADDEYYHVAVVVDRTNDNLYVYVNGQTQTGFNPYSIAALTGSISNTENFRMFDGFDPNAETPLLDGHLDDVRIWGDVRTQQEIQDNLDIELDGTESNLLAYWKLNGTPEATVGSTVLDETSNSYDLTPNSATTLTYEAAGRLVYDGTTPLSTTSGHIITIEDGIHSVPSNSFSITDTGVQAAWPARWPQVRGMYTISGRTNVLGNTDYTTWTYNSDIVLCQGFYPTPNQVEITYDDINAQRSTYPNCKIFMYCIVCWGQEASDTSYTHRRVQRDTIVNNSAEDEWYLKHPTSGNYLYGKAGTDQYGYILTNVSDVCPTVGGKNFNTAYIDYLYYKLSQGTNSKDLMSLIDGLYFDGIDIDNAFPQPTDGLDGSDYDGAPDYNVDGVANDSQSDYRAGMIEISDYAETAAKNDYSKTDWFVSTNGGRDYDISVGTISNYQWYHELGHWRLQENGEGRWGISYVGSQYITAGSNMQNRLFGDEPQGVVRAAEHSMLFCKPESETGVKPYCLIHYDLDQGGNGLAAGDITEDTWKLIEFIHAVCMSTEFMMPGPQITRQQPCPDYDLYIVDTGNPLSTRSLGTLSSDGQTFTQRSPDSTEDGGQWYITEFDNGYFWFNADPPDNGSTWPQPSNAATLDNDMPTPPGGKKGIFFDNSTYVNTTDSLSAQGFSSSRYDGSDATTITAGPFEGGWVLWVDV
jgi:hypothetical protein